MLPKHRFEVVVAAAAVTFLLAGGVEYRAQAAEQALAAQPQAASVQSQPASAGAAGRAAVSMAVSFKAGALTIEVQNALLAEVLKEVCRQIGAELDFPADAQDRVTASLGPAPAKVVLAALLGNTRFDFASSGRIDNPTALASIVVTPKNPGGGALVVSPPSVQKPAAVAQPATPQDPAARVAAARQQPALASLRDLLEQAKAAGPPSPDSPDMQVDTASPKLVEDLLKGLDTKVADAAAQPPPDQAAPVPVTPPAGRRHRH